MAARNTAPMFSGGAASSRVSGIGGSPGGKQPTQPGLAVASGTPIFVAEKLFDEFSLGRINAGSAHHSPSSSGDFSRSGGAATGGAARIGKASEGSSGSGGGGDAGTFQPSAPPFECIGRSNVELYGFNDIFGGVPGIKSKNGGGEDDIFLMPGGATGGASSSSSPRGVGGGSGGSGAAPTHQRSSSSPLGFESRARSSDRSDAETNQSHQHTSSSGTGTGTGIGKTGSPLISDTPPPPPPPTSYSPKPVRDREGSSSSSSAGPHGTSRLRHSGTTDAKVAAGTSDRPHQRGESSSQTQQNKTPPYAVKPPPERGSLSHQPISGSSHHPSSAASSHHPSSAAPSHHPSSAPPQPDSARVASPPPPPSAAAAGSTAATMPSCLPSVTSCSPRLGSGSGEKLSSSESGDMKAQLNRMPVFDAAAETRSGSDRIKEKPSAADEVLLPREINSSSSSSSSKIKPDSGRNSSPRKSKRQSATERLKAVFFPDLGKKEEKSKSKSWFTVGDLKLVTQPTEVPPPNRAPPEMVDPAQESNPVPKLRRDERWRRNSCEFPLGKGSLKEAPVPQPQAEDLAGLSSSAMAMKEAVERAEAKLRQKKKSAEVFPETIETETEKQQRVGSKPDDLRSDIRSDHRAGEIDKRAVERAAHELREKALKKAAERAVAAAETGRSNSAPKQRISDEAERNAKKVFFSGEQCKPVSKAETTSSNSEPVANGNLEKEKKQRKESIDRALEERAARALAEKNQRELTAQQEREERQRVSAAVDAQINAWVSGKEGNLRALLSSLQNVLWPGSGWQPVPSSELTNEASVKKAYRKATLFVHPDKVQQRTTQQKLVAEKVFDLLKAAWTKFNSQEAFFMQVS